MMILPNLKIRWRMEKTNKVIYLGGLYSRQIYN